MTKPALLSLDEHKGAEKLLISKAFPISKKRGWQLSTFASTGSTLAARQANEQSSFQARDSLAGRTVLCKLHRNKIM